MHFGIKKGLISTTNQKESLKDWDSEIDIIPFSEWLLDNFSFMEV
jgi:hypothetical protein